jgi:hypothetical protein
MTDESDDEPTEAEQERVRLLCLDAARDVMQQLDYKDDPKRDTVARLVLQAMGAVHAVECGDVDVDVEHVVGTALWEHIAWGGEPDSSTQPYSIGGVLITGYARAARLLEACRVFHDNIDDNYDFGIPTTHVREVLAALAADDDETKFFPAEPGDQTGDEVIE